MGASRFISAHVLVGEPAAAPDQVRGRLSPEHALLVSSPRADMGGWIDEEGGWDKDAALRYPRASHVALPRDAVTLGADLTKHVP